MTEDLLDSLAGERETVRAMGACETALREHSIGAPVMSPLSERIEQALSVARSAIGLAGFDGVELDYLTARLADTLRGESRDPLLRKFRAVQTVRRFATRFYRDWLETTGTHPFFGWKPGSEGWSVLLNFFAPILPAELAGVDKAFASLPHEFVATQLIRYRPESKGGAGRLGHQRLTVLLAVKCGALGYRSNGGERPEDTVDRILENDLKPALRTFREYAARTRGPTFPPVRSGNGLSMWNPETPEAPHGHAQQTRRPQDDARARRRRDRRT